MKKITLFLLLTLLFLLSGCKDEVTLDTCTFVIIEEQSTNACSLEDRTDLLLDVFGQFKNQLPTEDYTVKLEPLTYKSGTTLSSESVRFRLILEDVPINVMDSEINELLEFANTYLTHIEENIHVAQESVIRFEFQDMGSYIEVINDFGEYSIKGELFHDVTGEHSFEGLLEDVASSTEVESISLRVLVDLNYITMNINTVHKTARITYLFPEL